jgi:hypothetical protein
LGIASSTELNRFLFALKDFTTHARVFGAKVDGLGSLLQMCEVNAYKSVEASL